MARCWFSVPLILFFVAVVSAQNPPQSDPQALSLASQSIAALTAGNTISDVTLNGTGVWTVAANSETASATLLAKGTSESRFNIALSAGNRSEIRNDNSTSALGEVLASNGSIFQWGSENCMVNAAWFFPQLSVLGETGNSSLILSYIGQESRNGEAVQHIQSYLYSSVNTAALQQWSTMDIYLDSVSLLPSAFVFNTYSPDGSQTVPVEVDFSNYQPFSGVLIPFHIQRYVAGNIGLDFSVTGVQLNSGLQDGLFTIQ